MNIRKGFQTSYVTFKVMIPIILISLLIGISYFNDMYVEDMYKFNTDKFFCI